MASVVAIRTMVRNNYLDQFKTLLKDIGTEVETYNNIHEVVHADIGMDTDNSVRVDDRHYRIPPATQFEAMNIADHDSRWLYRIPPTTQIEAMNIADHDSRSLYRIPPTTQIEADYSSPWLYRGPPTIQTEAMNIAEQGKHCNLQVEMEYDNMASEAAKNEPMNSADHGSHSNLPRTYEIQDTMTEISETMAGKDSEDRHTRCDMYADMIRDIMDTTRQAQESIDDQQIILNDFERKIQAGQMIELDILANTKLAIYICSTLGISHERISSERQRLDKPMEFMSHYSELPFHWEPEIIEEVAIVDTTDMQPAQAAAHQEFCEALRNYANVMITLDQVAGSVNLIKNKILVGRLIEIDDKSLNIGFIKNMIVNHMQLPSDHTQVSHSNYELKFRPVFAMPIQPKLVADTPSKAVIQPYQDASPIDHISTRQMQPLDDIIHSLPRSLAFSLYSFVNQAGRICK